MNILVTGSNGFVGKNLVEALKNIRDCKDRTRAGLKIDAIYEFDINTEYSKLDLYCSNADVVFNLAGINRPKQQTEYMQGNFEFPSVLLETLKAHQNNCPIVLASSVQASLMGRYEGSEYGRSKLAGETLFFQHSEDTGADVYVYRFPNLFGKWCRPNYNSVIATFCNNIAHNYPITVNDSTTELELLYIDDLVNELIGLLEGKEHRCDFDGMVAIPNSNGKFCYVPTTYKVSLGEVVSILNRFKMFPETLTVPEIPKDSFEKKLFSTYLSYLSKESAVINLKSKLDDRGSFTELLKTEKCGQISINISKPGMVKGQHWHNSKWEIFVVVSGEGLIQQRKIGSNEVLNFYASGKNIKAVCILPGYTHNIINLSDTEDLITIMWANEVFDSANPDTFYEIVEE